jgi:DNA-binding transcriptional MerR regulator
VICRLTSLLANTGEEFMEKYAALTGSLSHRAADVAVQDSFMFIGELAKLTGADPKTIRFYERAELLSPPRHGRFRTYLASDVKRLQNILLLRRLGVSIAQIREIFELVGGHIDVLSDGRAVSILRRHLKSLHSKHMELTQQIEQTNSALHRLTA